MSGSGVVIRGRDIAKRVHLIDEVRGFAILCMVVYHTFYDLVELFHVKIALFRHPFIQMLVYIFVGIFVFISGTACHFSRNNLKRGMICFALGMGLTLFSLVFMPNMPDAFGILHLLGICMILFALLQKQLKKIPPIVGIVGCLLLFFLTYSTQSGYWGLKGILELPLPDAWYRTSFLFPLGFPSADFYSVDYFPILPWVFCFLGGTFFGVLVKEKKLPVWVYRRHIPPLAFVGRNTLLVYLLHQPVVFGVLWVIFQLIS